jgi:hypothetical protein
MSICPALQELVEAGLLAITKGRREDKPERPNLYRITFLGTVDGPATWREPKVVPMPKKPRRKSWKEAAILEAKGKVASK